MDAMQPEFDDEDPINPFDFWTGANFKLKIRDVEGYRNYDKSEFSRQEPLSQDDDELETIYNKIHGLAEFTDPSSYKTYNELSAKLTSVLGEANATMGAPSLAQEASLGEEATAPTYKAAAEETINAADISLDTVTSTEDDDTMSYFSKLMSD